MAKQKSTSRPLVANKLGGSQSSSKGKETPHHKTHYWNSYSPTAWKGVKDDLFHLWLTHTSDLNGRILAPETDLLLKRFQSQVCLWHIFELNCICIFEVRAWHDWYYNDTQQYRKGILIFIACAKVSYHRDIVLLAEFFTELCWNKTLSSGAAVQI